MAALNAAIRQKRFTQVKLLLDIGVDVNQQDSEMRRTALMQLCFLDDESKAAKYVRVLLERGAKVGLKDKDGLTALSHACKLGLEQLVSIMLEEASDFDLNSQDKLGNTALHHAALSGNFVVLNLLLNKLKRFKMNVDKLNKRGETPLIVASKSGNFFCARILVSEGKASKGARDYIEFKTAEEWGRTKESLRSASKSPLFRVMQLPPRMSLDSQSRGSKDDVHLPKQKDNKRPNTAPGHLLSQPSERTHRENLRDLFRVYEEHVSGAFRIGVKPRPVIVTTESVCSINDGTSQDDDDICELPYPPVSPISFQPVGRRFSISKAGKLALNTNTVLRRASLATVSTTGSPSKPLQRRGSQSFGPNNGRRLSQSMPLSPRVRRGSMNVMSKITKVPSLNVNKEKSETKNTLAPTDSSSTPSRPSISVNSDKLFAKLQTLAEESDSEGEENGGEILHRSSPANLFSQMWLHYCQADRN